MMNDLVVKSKRLSYLLRHNPDAAGLTLDENGWTDVAQLLSATGFTRDELDCVVANNDKKRFTFSSDGAKIRAAQGHSLPINLDLEPQEPPDVLYHGTATRFLKPIMREGLKQMKRTHVHLTDNRDTALSVGKRYGDPVILLIQAAKMRADGVEFYRADNGVWLTKYVSPLYFEVEV